MAEAEVFYLGTLMVSIAALALASWAVAWNRGRLALMAALGLIAASLLTFIAGYRLPGPNGIFLMAGSAAGGAIGSGALFGLAAAFLIGRLRARDRASNKRA